MQANFPRCEDGCFTSGCFTVCICSHLHADAASLWPHHRCGFDFPVQVLTATAAPPVVLILLEIRGSFPSFLCVFFFFFTSLGFTNALRPPGQRPHRLKSQRAYAHGCSRAQFKQRLVDRSDAISPVETHIWCPIAGGTVKKKKEWRNRDREKAREVKKKGGSEDQHQDQLYLHCSILNANVASVTSKGICGDILETEN